MSITLTKDKQILFSGFPSQSKQPLTDQVQPVISPTPKVNAPVVPKKVTPIKPAPVATTPKATISPAAPMTFNAQQLSGLNAAYQRQQQGKSTPTDTKNLQYATARGFKPQSGAPAPQSGALAPQSGAPAQQSGAPAQQKDKTIPTPTPTSIDPVKTPLEQQIQALQDQIAGYKAPGTTETDISSQQAALQSKLDALNGLSMGGLAGQGRGIPQELLRGQASLQASSLQGQQDTLQRQLGLEQAKRQASFDVASKELEYKTAEEAKYQPQAVPSGQSMIQLNPKTGKYETIFSAAEKSVNVPYGGTLVDPATGKVIAYGQDKPITVGAGGTVVDSAGNIIATGQPKQTTLQQNYQTAVDQGYKGTQMQYQSDIANQKLTAGEKEFKDYQTSGGKGNIIDFYSAKKQAGQAKLDQETVDMLSDYFVASGTIPPGLARNAQAAAQIYSEAAQKAGGKNIVLNKAANDANKSALSDVTKKKAISESLEITAKAQLDLALKQSAKVSDAERTDSAAWNKIIQNTVQGLWSDPSLTGFQNVILTTLNEYAKVMTGSTGGAAVSDSARNEAQKLLSSSMSPDTFTNAIELMKQEMDNRLSGWNAEITSLQTDISTPLSETGGSGTPPSITGNTNTSQSTPPSGNVSGMGW